MLFRDAHGPAFVFQYPMIPTVAFDGDLRVAFNDVCGVLPAYRAWFGIVVGIAYGPHISGLHTVVGLLPSLV